MYLKDAVIPRYRAMIVPTEELKRKIKLNESYLCEKSTWYCIDGKLQYFKIRSDFRLFTERFFSMFGRGILGLDTLDYEVAYVETISPGIKNSALEPKCGLLSENFQLPEYNYYLVSELLKPKISAFVSYGGYTLKSLLSFFKDYLGEDEYNANEIFLITLFIADAFTHQEDRNYNNICFKVPKIEGVLHEKRLRPEILSTIPAASDEYAIGTNGTILLKNFTPSKVYDNERILGVDHRNVFTYSPNKVWCPLFPFSQETLFKNQEQALAYQQQCDGLDPNLLELYLEYPHICKPLFERLAYDSEYRRILENFRGSASPIILTDKSLERVTTTLRDKQKVFERILTY